MRAIRIFLLVLIIIGIVLLCTQKFWVPRLVDFIIQHDNPSTKSAETQNGTGKFFGNQAKGDLNGDGLPDLAYIFTKDGGGSGTFYYVIVSLKKAGSKDNFVDTNEVFLGDRIAPQTTEIRNGLLIVNYADRKPGEPMTTKSSLGVSKYLKVTGSTLTVLK